MSQLIQTSIISQVFHISLCEPGSPAEQYSLYVVGRKDNGVHLQVWVANFFFGGSNADLEASIRLPLANMPKNAVRLDVLASNHHTSAVLHGCLFRVYDTWIYRRSLRLPVIKHVQEFIGQTVTDEQVRELL